MDEESLTSEYVWNAIHYLEEDSDGKHGDFIAVIAVLLIALSICVCGVCLYLRGL